LLLLLVRTHLYKTNRKRRKKGERFFQAKHLFLVFLLANIFLIFSSEEKIIWRAAKASHDCRGCVTEYLTLVINHSHIGTRGISLKIAEEAKNVFGNSSMGIDEISTGKSDNNIAEIWMTFKITVPSCHFQTGICLKWPFK